MASMVIDLPADLEPEVRRLAQDSLTVTDNRTGKTYEFPITDGTIRAGSLGARVGRTAGISLAAGRRAKGRACGMWSP